MTAIFLSAKSLYHACNAPKRNLLLPTLLQPRLIFSSAKPLCHTDRQEKMQTVAYIASTRRHFCRQNGCFVHTKCRKAQLAVADAAKNQLQPLSTKPFAFAYRRRKAQTAVVGLRKVRHYPAAVQAHRRANNILAYRRSAKRQVLSQNSRKVRNLTSPRLRAERCGLLILSATIFNFCPCHS